jgi:hypothetical protein
MTSTTATTDGVRSGLDMDFTLACSQLARARLHRRQKDSPQNRARVMQCLAHVDDLLDLYLEVGSSW